eukprot:2387188-Amphidinium_carterae.1
MINEILQEDLLPSYPSDTMACFGDHVQRKLGVRCNRDLECSSEHSNITRGKHVARRISMLISALSCGRVTCGNKEHNVLCPMVPTAP